MVGRRFKSQVARLVRLSNDIVGRRDGGHGNLRRRASVRRLMCTDIVCTMKAEYKFSLSIRRRSFDRVMGVGSRRVVCHLNSVMYSISYDILERFDHGLGTVRDREEVKCIEEGSLRKDKQATLSTSESTKQSKKSRRTKRVQGSNSRLSGKRQTNGVRSTSRVQRSMQRSIDNEKKDRPTMQPTKSTMSNRTRTARSIVSGKSIRSGETNRSTNEKDNARSSDSTVPLRSSSARLGERLSRVGSLNIDGRTRCARTSFFFSRGKRTDVNAVRARSRGGGRFVHRFRRSEGTTLTNGCGCLGPGGSTAMPDRCVGRILVENANFVNNGNEMYGVFRARVSTKAETGHVGTRCNRKNTN